MVSITGVRVASRRLGSLPPAACAALRWRLHAPSRASSSRALSSVVLLAASAVLGCSEGNSDPLASAGTAGSAGTSGGQTGSSGTAGTAGSGSATAGASAGGAAGAGSGGTGPAAEPLILFDLSAPADVEGWQFAYAEPAGLIPEAVAADAGDVPPQEGVATAVHDAMGDPTGNPGSIRLALPFNAPAQKISFEVSVATDNVGVDLAMHSISARVSVLSGYSTDPNNPPGLKLYVKTGETFFYADSGYINIAPGSDWQTFTWANVSAPGYPMRSPTNPPYPAEFIPTDVRQIGIEFDTGSGGVYSPATVLLDTVAVY